MRSLFTIALALLVGWMAVGRVAAQQTSPHESPAGMGALPPPADPADLRVKNHLADPNYQLQADDVLEVVVFREVDLTTDGMVRKDGTFDMKLIGAVPVAGLTADQAAERIRASLGKDYLVDPRVNVGIVDYARKKIDILGQVRSPGVYTYPSRGPLFLGDAVALSGGFLPGADLGRVLVSRTENGRAQSLEVDASATGMANVFALRPDDMISVAPLPLRHFTVLGQVARPGTYDFTSEHPVYLTDAIAVAGGFTRIADSSHVLLKRTENGRETVQDLNAKAMANSAGTQRLQLQDEDTITVTESMF